MRQEGMAIHLGIALQARRFCRARGGGRSVLRTSAACLSPGQQKEPPRPESPQKTTQEFHTIVPSIGSSLGKARRRQEDSFESFSHENGATINLATHRLGLTNVAKGSSRVLPP